MVIFVVFTLVILLLLPFLLGPLSHLWSVLSQRTLRHQNKNQNNNNQNNNNNLSHIIEPLINLHQKFPHLGIGDRGFSLKNIRTSSMDDSLEKKAMRRKMTLQLTEVDEAQKQAQAQFTMGQNRSPKGPTPLPSPSGPSPLKKSSSTRSNCLCSPTTHVGSFRCRLHRNDSNFRRGYSIGSDLSDLGDKFSTKSTLSPSSLKT